MSPRLADADRRLLLMIVRLLGAVLAIALTAAAVGAFVTIRATVRAEDAADIAREAAQRAATNRVSLDRFLRESRERRNEACRISEYEQAREVRQLRRTYEFLPRLLREDPDGILAAASRGSLAALESDARTDNAPAYCDEPGVAAEARGEPPVGLPEPDPKIPPRPPGLRGLR